MHSLFNQPSLKRLLQLIIRSDYDPNPPSPLGNSPSSTTSGGLCAGEKWREQAVKVLAAHLKKGAAVEELERAITQQEANSKCVIVKKAITAKLPVRHTDAPLLLLFL